MFKDQLDVSIQTHMLRRSIHGSCRALQLARLLRLARHCQEAPLEQRLTPSDFPLAKQIGLDQLLLDQLAVDPAFEEVVPLAPLQWGLAYESWSQGGERRQ